MHDVVIRNGTVIDGRGGRPVLADVAIDDGLITAVGVVADPGREELDATGLAVTPGFVDVHTHYDGQVTWDPLLTPSIWHGVTTVVMGNCGVGFAPAAPDRHDWLIGLMEGVEGIPGASLREAIRWDWESVGRVPRRGRPHPARGRRRRADPARRGARVRDGRAGRGQRARHRRRHRAWPQLVTEGVAAGAVGVSVNRLELHKAVDGREVPGTFAATRRSSPSCAPPHAGSPDAVFTTILPGAAGSDRAVWDREVDWLSAISRETGLAVTFPFGASSGHGKWQDRLARLERENADGARIVPQVGSHGQGLFCGLRTSHPFRGRPSYEALADLPVAERAARMAEPDVHAARSSPRSPRRAPRACATSCSPNPARCSRTTRSRTTSPTRRPASPRRPTRSASIPKSSSTTGPSPTTATRSSTSSSVGTAATSTRAPSCSRTRTACSASVTAARTSTSSATPATRRSSSRTGCATASAARCRSRPR